MPTPFVCIIDTDGSAGVGGVDFTSLAAWWSALRNTSGTLVLGSRDPIAVPGTLTGTIADNTAVTQAVTGATARLIHALAGGGFALLTLVSGSQVGGDDTHAWQVDGSNFFTPSGPRDLAIVTASCRGTTADTGAITFTQVYSQSNANPLVIQGDVDPTNRVWSTAKFRWEFAAAGGVVTIGGNNENLVLRNLQIRNTTPGTADTIAAVYAQNRSALLIDGCILRGGKHPLSIAGGQGRYVVQNSVLYGGDAAGAAILDATSNAPAIVQNCTLIGGAYGLRTTGGASCAAENCYAYGTTAAFAATGGGAISLNRCASSDATANGGTNLMVAAAGLSGVAKDTTAFRGVTGGSEDFGLAAGSPLAYAGVALSAGRGRLFADVSSAAEKGSGTYNRIGWTSLDYSACPVGILAFEVGSSTVILRIYSASNNRWFDGVDLPYDLSLHIPLPHPSTTGDWIAMVGDTHFGDFLKDTAGPAIDALNAGTTGTWNRATDGAWISGQKPCTGRIKHLMNLGDIGPTDSNQYGLGVANSTDIAASGKASYAQYQENLWNTSGLTTPAGAGCQSVPHADTWHYVGNHDTTAAMAAHCNSLNSKGICHVELGGFETFRLNQHGRANSDYTGTTYADIDELHQLADIGNNRFVFLNFYGSDAGNVSTGVSSLANRWTPADTAWAQWAMTTSLPAGANLFVFPHAPMGHATRFGHFEQPHDSNLEVTMSTTPWAFSACGHCHGFEPGLGPTWGSVAARNDYPARAAWDIGAHESPAVLRRRLRARGRAIRSIRA